jgi:uncharacterized membrane protein YraQ (UPF0718 family)
VAEFVGGPIMIVVVAAAFRIFLRDRLLREAREHADLGLAGSMEGHAAMDMSVKREGSFARRLFSREGYTSVSHVFVMEWAAIARDLVIGLLIAGAVAAPLFRFVRTGGRMMLRMMGGAPDTRHRG